MIYEQGDRRVASNVLHKILLGQQPEFQGFRFEALVSKKVIENIIEKYWNELMSWSTLPKQYYLNIYRIVHDW